MFFKSSFWHLKLTRFHNGERQISRNAGPDKHVNDIFQGRGSYDDGMAYLNDLALPTPPHYSIEFGEDLTHYINRIETFSNFYYDLLSDHLPVSEVSEGGTSMVSVNFNIKKQYLRK